MASLLQKKLDCIDSGCEPLPADKDFEKTEPELEPIDYIPDEETPIDNALRERMTKLAGILKNKNEVIIHLIIIKEMLL